MTATETAMTTVEDGGFVLKSENLGFWSVFTDSLFLFLLFTLLLLLVLGVVLSSDLKERMNEAGNRFTCYCVALIVCLALASSSASCLVFQDTRKSVLFESSGSIADSSRSAGIEQAVGVSRPVGIDYTIEISVKSNEKSLVVKDEEGKFYVTDDFSFVDGHAESENVTEAKYFVYENRIERDRADTDDGFEHAIERGSMRAEYLDLEHAEGYDDHVYRDGSRFFYVFGEHRDLVMIEFDPSDSDPWNVDDISSGDRKTDKNLSGVMVKHDSSERSNFKDSSPEHHNIKERDLEKRHSRLKRDYGNCDSYSLRFFVRALGLEFC